MPIRDAIVLLTIVGTLPICFFRPFYGICLWTIVSFLNPQTLTYGPAFGLPLAICVGLPTMVGFFVFVKGWPSRLGNLEVLLLVVLWLWFTVTSQVSTSTPLFIHHAVDTWSRWEFVSKILLMTVVTIATVDNFERLRILMMTLAGCFGVFVAKMFPVIVLTGGTFRLYGPDYSMISDNNDFGLALVMTAPLFFFLAVTEKKRWVKRLFAALFIMNIPAVFCTYSRGALVGLIVVFLGMFMKSKNRFALIPVIALAVMVAVVFAPASWKHRMDPTSDDVMDASAQGRINAWTFAFHLAEDYPITGGGFATFTPQLFDRYAPKAKDIHGPHSVYFQVLGEHGFVGLLLYLLMVLIVFIDLFRVIRLAKYYEDELVVQYANMLRFSLVGFLTSGLFLGRAYFDYYFTLVACVAILRIVAQRRWAEREYEEPAEKTEDESETVPYEEMALGGAQ